MADQEPVVLNEKGGEADKSLDSAEIVKKLRVSITNLKGSHMSDDGSKVDYSQIATSPKFEEYCNTAALLKFIKPETFNEEKRKAFFINIYNSLTVHAMVYQAQIGRLPESPVKVPGFWKIHCYNIGGSVYTLDEIEHGVLRTNNGHPAAGKPQFDESDPRLKVALTKLDPRIHFALNCGARSCPPIRIYTEERIDNQLEMATKSFVSQEVTVVGKERNLRYTCRNFSFGMGLTLDPITGRCLSGSLNILGIKMRRLLRLFRENLKLFSKTMTGHQTY
eukprot:TRINITY_DN24186_c0_g1_i1.p1 TRINITY_DN24186_c0_g1~~TRINITY_DN24186_c0_g1_i1.p1  ORF type:complete len:278 (+),score=39.79 TRINITY_DN24186_c0_g1_i1:264-1097(+)